VAARLQLNVLELEARSIRNEMTRAICLVEDVVVALNPYVVCRDGGRAVEQDVVPQFHDGIALREGPAQLVSIFYGCRFAAAGAHVEVVAVPGGREREEEGSGERAHLCGEWNDLLISSLSYRRRAVLSRRSSKSRPRGRGRRAAASRAP